MTKHLDHVLKRHRDFTILACLHARLQPMSIRTPIPPYMYTACASLIRRMTLQVLRVAGFYSKSLLLEVVSYILSSFPRYFFSRPHSTPLTIHEEAHTSTQRSRHKSSVVTMSPSILQLQTQAACGTQPIAIRNSKGRSDDSLATLSSSSRSASPRASIDIVRCSRCQRSLTIDPTSSSSAQGVVRFGLNSYYCSRCANHVGFIK